MSKGGGQTQGYRYYMSMLSGLCRGPIDELVEIKVGDKEAWNGHACSDTPQYIDAPNLFGGDDKEGGVQGPFAVFLGDEDQVLPGAQTVAAGGGLGSTIINIVKGAVVRSLPDVRASIGGRVSQMRGVTTVWFNGLVAAMNPYLKTWAFRVRRAKAGWYGGVAWYPDKATIFLGGDNLTVTSNQAIDLKVTLNEDSTQTITFARNVQSGDTVTVNGIGISYVEKSDDGPADFEIVPNKDRLRSVRNLANYVNARSTAFKATATYTDTTVTFAANKGAQQIYAMNPSHIVFQCYTDPLWGRGLTWDDLDQNAFVYAANTLCNEGFGLALIWYRKEDIDVFIQKVCDLVGAVTYTDRETGLIVFKLVRNDYVLADVPLFTFETGLLSIDDDDSASSDNSYNEVIGTSRDPVSNIDFQVRAQNLASFQAKGDISSLDQDYKGIPTKGLLARVVTRDLRAMGSGLKKYSVTLDRRGWRVTPGSVIRITAPSRGLQDVVLRVGEIDDGNMVNGQIKLKCAIDVFGLPNVTYHEVVDNGWVAPSKVATPALDERLVEASYRDVYRMQGAAEAEAVDATTAYIGQLAVAPNATSMEYDLLTKAEGEASYVDRGRGPFTGYATLAADIGPLDTAVPLTALVMFNEDNVGQGLLIGDELVRLDALDTAAGIATIARGTGDTIPRAHEAGDLLWTIDDDLVSDGQAYFAGETVNSLVLTRTSSDLLDPEQADVQEIELAGRPARPYPPAGVTVDGASVFGLTGEHPEPALAWTERNRVTQHDVLIGYDEATVLGEIGQTYTVRIYDAKSGALLRTVSDIAGTTWAYTADLSAADGSPSRVRIELESARDGLASWQCYSFLVALKAGWGYSWGLNWGG